MENKIRIRTKFNPERIISEVQYPQYQSDFSNIVANTASRVLELQEKGIQEALTKLGYVKQEWISVKDRLPDPGQDYDCVQVLVYYRDQVTGQMDMRTEYFWKDSAIIDNDVPGFCIYGITHWMPLPAAPEGI